jgi:O-6-methylguanine DNA methyltransferase
VQTCIVNAVHEIIQIADIETTLGMIRVASSDRGLAYLGFPVTNGRGFTGWRQRFAPGCWSRNDPTANQVICDQIDQFIARERNQFDIPTDLRATPFQEKIFKVVCEIRYGDTLSYKEVARRAGDERAVRAVGTALGANPLALVIPCHRVVGSDGKLQGYAGGVQVKARLLAAEQTGPTNGRLF